MEKESQVVVTWKEPLSTLGVTEEMIVEALKRGVRDHLLDSPQFVDQIRSAIAKAESLMKEDDLVKALKDDMFAILRDKIASQRSELAQCLRDYTAFRAQFGSEYVHRRFEELRAKLETLDRT
jgi:hypothetical protein